MPLHVCGQITAGRWRFDFPDGRKQIVRAGEAYFIPAGCLHRSLRFSSKVTVSRWAHLAVSEGVKGDPLLRLQIPPRIRGAAGRRIGEVCEALSKFGPGDLELTAAAMKMSLLFQLVSVLGECGPPRPRERGMPLGDETDPDLTRLGAALDAMRQYHFEPLNIADLAAKAHLSVSRFRAVFRRVMGMPPHRYIQSLRFELAKGLLERGDEPVKVIAERVGYDNAYLFSRLFKRDVGTSPTEYRQLHRHHE